MSINGIINFEVDSFMKDMKDPLTGTKFMNEDELTYQRNGEVSKSLTKLKGNETTDNTEGPVLSLNSN